MDSESLLHTFEIDGLRLKTGDIVATTNGAESTFRGQVWRLVGAIVPGPIHHTLVYVGPGPRFIEAGPAGVVEFEMADGRWDPAPLAELRGGLMDHLFGAAYPLHGRSLSPEDEARLRRGVADFCVAQVGKPYNMRFSDPYREDKYYCSQLIWQAYRRLGIRLRPRPSTDGSPRRKRIVFPSDLWHAAPSQHTLWPEALAESASSLREVIVDKVADVVETAVEAAVAVMTERVEVLEERVETLEAERVAATDVGKAAG